MTLGHPGSTTYFVSISGQEAPVFATSDSLEKKSVNRCIHSGPVGDKKVGLQESDSTS